MTSTSYASGMMEDWCIGDVSTTSSHLEQRPQI